MKGHHHHVSHFTIKSSVGRIREMAIAQVLHKQLQRIQGQNGTLETKRAHPWSWPFPVPPLLVFVPLQRHSPTLRHSSMQRAAFAEPFLSVGGQMKPNMILTCLTLLANQAISSRTFPSSKERVRYLSVSFNVQRENTRVDIVNVMLTVHGMCLIFDGYQQGCP